MYYQPAFSQTMRFTAAWQESSDSVAVAQRADFDVQPVADCNWLCELLTPAVDTLPPMEKVAYLAGASVAFALFDYVGFNSVRTNKNKIPYYRVAQGLAQTGITYYLYKYVSAGTALGFSVVWWTFGDDFIYYGFAELFNPGHPWESRGDLYNNVIRNHCTWAYWTPIGLSRGIKRNKVIAGDTLIAQALAGAAVGITMSVSF